MDHRWPLLLSSFGLLVIMPDLVAPSRANPPAPAAREANAATGIIDVDPETASNRALAEALAHLGAGRRETAQLQIEGLVARFPQSRAAERGRKVLAELYRTDSPPKLASTPPASEPSQLPNTPPLVVGQIRSLQEDLRLVAGDRMFFAPGSAELGAHARKIIHSQATWLKRHSTLIVEVEGHADDRDSGLDMMRLSLERATRVRDRLVELGIEPRRVRVRAQGRLQPVATCDGPECEAQNRRVLLLVVGRANDGPSAAPR